MSLTTLSYKEANKIIDIYADILSQSPELGQNNKHRYSALKGYDIFDIDNALKLCCAYRVFNTFDLNERTITKLKKESSVDGGACMHFFSLFAPDNIVQKLNKLDYSNIENKVKAHQIEGNFFESDLWKEFSKRETSDSFLEYCLSIDKSDTEYWEKIYERLDITWDERDEYDEILNIIQNKDLFFRSVKLENKNQIAIGQIEKKHDSNTKSFYKKYKKSFEVAYVILIISLGLFFPVLRIVIFCLFLIMSFIQTYFWLKEPIENKWSFALHLFYMTLYIVGVFTPKLGFYILMFCIASSAISLIKDWLKSTTNTIEELKNDTTVEKQF